MKRNESFIYKDPTHVSVKPIADWRRMLHDAGFRVIRDGTDTLWDAPYVSRVPTALQWPLFAGVAQLMWMVHVTFPWPWGENYVCFARKY